ncbi:hypothetical protein [Myxococcus landrumensis]|uniref:Lipoprotein n=1 Tax=Myxococcus landrumensis TaxID=2813577 RepID=A0ABX7NED9_9BACT|nr:hypothetical protein [Myxococcus landrumus]QSQ17174.1 hypothetical protein JY572_14410 [Myxococcus landrumus]
MLLTNVWPIVLASIATTSENPTRFEWQKLLISSFGPGITTALLVGLFSWLFNRILERQKRTHAEELLNIGSNLNKSLQEKLEADRSERAELLEHLRRDIQDALASRARRAEYLRAQITSLYGPLAFHLESTAVRHNCATDMIEAVTRLKSAFDGQSPNSLTKEREAKIDSTIEKYQALTLESVSATISLLKSNWGWLDEADRPAIVDLMKNADRFDTETKTTDDYARIVAMYESTVSGKAILNPPNIIPGPLAAYFQTRLNEKQQELSGLTVSPVRAKAIEKLAS